VQVTGDGGLSEHESSKRRTGCARFYPAGGTPRGQYSLAAHVAGRTHDGLRIGVPLRRKEIADI